MLLAQRVVVKKLQGRIGIAGMKHSHTRLDQLLGLLVVIVTNL